MATARAVSYCGDFLAATALALNLQTHGDNGYGVAALLIAGALPVAVLAPAAGRLADRFDSRALLVAASVVQALVCLALAFTGSPAVTIALVAVISSGLAITQPTMSALVPDMVGKENLPQAMSVTQTAGAVGMLVGPALGGLLVGTYGVRLPLLLDAASYVALAGAAILIRTRRGGALAPPAPLSGSSVPASSGSSVSARSGSSVPAPSVAEWRIRNDRLLVTLLAAVGAVIAAVTAISVVEIFFVRETLGGSPTVYGLIAATWTLGVMLGAWPWGRSRGGDRALVTVELALLAGVSAVVLVSATVTSALWLVPLYLCGGLLNAGLNVLSGVVVGRRAPAHLRGRVFGVVSSVTNTANMAGYVAGGLLLPLASPRMIIAGTGIAGLLVAGMFLVPVLRTYSRSQSAGASARPVPAAATAPAPGSYRARVPE